MAYEIVKLETEKVDGVVVAHCVTWGLSTDPTIQVSYRCSPGEIRAGEERACCIELFKRAGIQAQLDALLAAKAKVCQVEINSAIKARSAIAVGEII